MSQTTCEKALDRLLRRFCFLWMSSHKNNPHFLLLPEMFIFPLEMIFELDIGNMQR